MTKEKLMSIALATSMELRRGNVVAKKNKAAQGFFAREITREPFHAASFLRGVEFAYNQLKGTKP